MPRELALKILHEGTVIPATPLVLDENRNFDEQGQKRLVRYYLEAGSGGIATAVHSTQFEIRDEKVNLFEKVLKTVSETIDEYEKETGKTIVKVAGVCGDTEQAVKEAKIIKSYGYDAVLLSPIGAENTEDGMIARAKAVASEISVIGFYLQLACGGRYLSYNFWKRFCDLDNVVAVKCAPFNRYFTYDVIRAVANSKRCEQITLYTGNDDNIISDLTSKFKFTTEGGKEVELGFKGGLLGHWSVWTKKVVEIFNKIKSEGFNDQINVLAGKVTDANSAIFDVKNTFKGCISGIHEILRRQGLIKGIWCVSEKEKLSDGQMEEIDRVYKAYPELNDDEFVKEFLSRYNG